MLKILMIVAVTIFSAWFLVNTYGENSGEPEVIQADDAVTHSLTGDSGIGTSKRSTSDPGLSGATENMGDLILYGGERILKIPRSDVSAFKDEAQRRLGKLGEFGTYLYKGEANGRAVVYLDSNEMMLQIDQSQKAALMLLVSNDEERDRGIAKHPHNELLGSKEKMPLEDMVDELFNFRDPVYIPQDIVPYDNEPVPKVIVQKQTGVAVQHITVDGLDYLALGFGPFADDNMQEIINRNYVFQSGGGGSLSASSEEDPIDPVPELSTVILISAGLFAILIVSKKFG